MKVTKELKIEVQNRVRTAIENKENAILKKLREENKDKLLEQLRLEKERISIQNKIDKIKKQLEKGGIHSYGSSQIKTYLTEGCRQKNNLFTSTTINSIMLQLQYQEGTQDIYKLLDGLIKNI